jgi:hypothetical protein
VSRIVGGATEAFEKRPSEAKAQVALGLFAARLKPCPFKTKML